MLIILSVLQKSPFRALNHNSLSLRHPRLIIGQTDTINYNYNEHFRAIQSTKITSKSHR